MKIAELKKAQLLKSAVLKTKKATLLYLEKLLL